MGVSMPHPKFLIAIALIVGAVCYLMFSGANDSMVYYYTVSELQAKAPQLEGKGVRVSAHVIPGSIVQQPGSKSVHFQIEDKGSQVKLPVQYAGIIPDTFKDNAEVVVEGRYDRTTGVFHANTLLAKCPSKYQAMGDQHPADVPLRKTTD